MNKLHEITVEYVKVHSKLTDMNLVVHNLYDGYSHNTISFKTPFEEIAYLVLRGAPVKHAVWETIIKSARRKTDAEIDNEEERKEIARMARKLLEEES